MSNVETTTPLVNVQVLVPVLPSVEKPENCVPNSARSNVLLVAPPNVNLSVPVPTTLPVIV